MSLAIEAGSSIPSDAIWLNVFLSECLFGDLIQHLNVARNLLHNSLEQKEGFSWSDGQTSSG